MDPLSLTASIIAILELSGKVIQYLGDVKNAPKARASLAIEASNLYSLLVTLRYRLEEGQQSDEAWYAAVRSLGAQNGPLDQYKDKLEQLRHKLGGGSWIKDVGHSLLWKFSKEEVRDLLSSMESLKSLIQISLEMDHFKLSQAIKSSLDFYGTELSLQVNSLSQTFHDEKFMREQESINYLHRELHGWLSPCNPEILHSKACGNHHSGTNGWFLNGPLKWLAENKSDSTAILLLKGTSGTGKSTLLSQAIKQAKSSASQDSVLYFYCSFDDLATQNPVNILASFIVQLSHQVPELLDDFMPEYLKAKERSTPAQLSIEKLEKVFITHAKGLPRVYLFLDAINECQDGSATVDLLVRLSRRCSNLRMLITSTRDLNIREPSSTIQTLVVQMDSSRVTKDISIFVDDMLALDPSLRNITEELKADIGSTVISSADGMFRYARWLLNHLAGQRTGRAIRTALTEMPRSLNETYAMLLDRIPKSSPDREFLRRCLVWLSFAARPLKLQELAEAVIIEHTDEDIDNDSRLHSPEFLLDISQGLFDLDINSGRVALAHSSVKTFLLSDWIQNTSVADFALSNAKGHSEIIRLCLTYLSFSEFKTGYGASIRAFDSRFEKYLLLDYIVKNWTVHAQTVDHNTWRCIQAFLDTRIYPNGGNFGWWLQCIRVVADADIIRSTHSIYYPASYGFTNLVKAILDNDSSVDLEAPGGRAGSTALQVASYRKQRDVCILLVEAGADAFSLDGTLTGTGLDGGFPSYFWAKVNGWDDVCKLMEAKSLEQGSTITKRYGIYSMEFALSVQAADAEYRSELWSGEEPPR